MIETIIDAMNTVSFELYGYPVRFFDVIIAFFIIGFVVSVFWRGAKA